MNMTHYMELLATNQPWNLLFFMAIPVILAEMIAITELLILSGWGDAAKLRPWNRTASMFAGVYFLGVVLYLVTTVVVPLTMNGGWRGIGDVIAVGSYLLGVVPLVAIALLDAGFSGKNKSVETKKHAHAFWVAVFLVLAHVAMIFGMLNPTILGYRPQTMPSVQAEMMMD